MKNLRSNGGFSLVELMIVIVIIGVLAAVAVPIYNNNVRKAKMSEADAALGSIRTQLRVYYGENGSYPVAASAVYVFEADWADVRSGELTGAYFTDSSYTYTGDGTDYSISCAAGGILDSPRTLDQDGAFGGGI